MASSRIDHPIRGLGVRDRRMTYALVSAAETSVTQAGPRPGSAVPSNARSGLVVQTSGEQSDDLTVKVQDSGMPTLGADGVRVGYYLTSEGATKERAWQAPSQLHGWRAAEYAAAATATFGAIDAAVIPSSQKMVMTYIQVTGTSPDPVYSRVYDPYAGTWGNAVALPGTSTDTGQFTAVCVLPGSERILALVTDDSIGNLTLGFNGGKHIYKSDDDGATWSAYARHVLDTSPNSAYTGIRSRLLALPNGDLMLFILANNAGTVRAYQYASSNLGASFRTVAAWNLSGTGPLSVADVVVLADGRVGMIALNASNYLTWRTVGSAWESLEDATVTEISASFTYAEVTACVDFDGVWYAFARENSTPETTTTWRSYDHGANWSNLLGIFNTGSTVDYPTRMTAVPAAGSVLLVHQWVASDGDEDGSIAVAVCGGWSSITTTGETTSFGADGITWFAMERPQETGWAITGAGTDALVSGGWWQITTTANTRYITDPPTALVTSTALDTIFEGQIDSGGSLTTNDIAIRPRLANATVDSWIVLRFTADEIRVVDLVSGSTLTTYEPTSNMTTPFQVRICMTAAASPILYVGFRRPGDALWEEVYDGAITNNGGAPAVEGNFEYGHIASSTAQSKWRMVGYQTGSAARPMWRTAASSTASLTSYRYGKVLTARPYPLGDSATAGATFLAAVDGPGATSDTFSIPCSHDYPISGLFPENSPSPLRTWRSTQIAAAEYVGWELAGGAASALLSSTHLLYVANANVRTIYWEGYTGGSWSTLGTLDLATGMSGLTYTRVGDRITIDVGSSSASRYIWRNELVGAHIALDAGEHRKIVANSEGLLAPSTTAGRKVELRIELEGGEPASGTGHIYHHTGVLVVHNVSTHSAYRWRIPAQTTCEGYFRAGIIEPFALATFGVEYGWGRTVEITPNAETWRDDAGTLYARSRGAAPRRWVVSWPQGVPQQRITRNSPPTPDYISSKAAYPAIGTYQDVPYLLAGLVDELAQGEEPCLMLARVPDASSSDTHVITDPRMFLYGRLTSPVTLDTALGDETTGEAIRVQQVTIEGIV